MGTSTVKNEAFLPLFGQVRDLLRPYERWYVPRRDEPGYYDLWSERDVVIEGRRRHEVYFAGLIIQKSFVGFYFMPVYAGGDLSRVFGADLLATLKGKSCFHLTRLTDELERQLGAALSAGHELYVERGWTQV